MKIYLTLRAEDDGDHTILTLRFSQPLDDLGRLEQRAQITRIKKSFETYSSRIDQVTLEDDILCARIANTIDNTLQLLLGHFVQSDWAYELERLDAHLRTPVKTAQIEVYLRDGDRARYCLRNNLVHVF